MKTILNTFLCLFLFSLGNFLYTAQAGAPVASSTSSDTPWYQKLRPSQYLPETFTAKYPYARTALDGICAVVGLGGVGLAAYTNKDALRANLPRAWNAVGTSAARGLDTASATITEYPFSSVCASGAAAGTGGWLLGLFMGKKAKTGFIPTTATEQQRLNHLATHVINTSFMEGARKSQALKELTSKPDTTWDATIERITDLGTHRTNLFDAYKAVYQAVEPGKVDNDYHQGVARVMYGKGNLGLPQKIQALQLQDASGRRASVT